VIINEIHSGFPVLSVLLFLPLIAAGVLMTMKDEAAANKLAQAACAAELLIAVYVWFNFVPDTADLQFVEKLGPVMGVSYHLGVDGISMLFVPATAALSLLAVLYTDASVKHNVSGYLAALMAFEATMMGAFMSVDLFLFWMFFVAELIPSYMLIVRWGTGSERKEAGANYLVYMLLASAAILVGFILLAMNHGGAGISFNYVELLKNPLPEKTQTLIFFILCLGFAIKAPLFPLHTWMPKVLEQGPVVGMSVFLVGIKLGTYAFLRFIIPLLPQAAQEWYWLLAMLGAVSMVYGALIALVQVNLRRMLAFASLSHMGVVMLGLFSLNFQGMQGGLLQMINLGITGAGLFFVAGFLFTRMGTPDVTRMGGLQTNAPLMAFTFLVIGLAGIGMPGTSGFNGEHLVMLGAFKKHWVMALFVGIGTFLTAAYFLWYYQRAFLGGTNKAISGIADLHAPEKFIAASLAGIIFWIGLYTTPFLLTMNGSIRAIEAHVAIGVVQASAAELQKETAQ
jgi:NADH-quinone oxidoreductase subunit M